MSSEVGSGHVAIVPRFTGFRKNVESQTDSAAKSAAAGFARVFSRGSAAAGTTAGRATGRNFGKGFSSATNGLGAAAAKKLGAEVASASRAVSSARLKEQDATGKLRVAEAQLTEARAKNTAGSARLVAAEERAASAQRSLTSAQSTTRDASVRLKDAQSDLATATSSAGAATTRSVGGFRRASTVIGGLRTAAGGLSRLFATGLGLGVGVAAAAALGRVVGRLTGYIRDSISTAAQWQTLNAQTAAVIKSTGGAANVTAGRIASLSQRLENQTATEAEAIQQGANLLLTFKGIRNEAGRGNKIFDQTTAASVDMAKAMGISVPAAALQLGKALNDPAKGLSKLTRVGVTFTDGQAKQVKALVASGRTLEAQKIILRELNSEFGGSGQAYAKTYAGALYRIRDAAGDFGASIASKALPAITKLLSTGADIINWAAGTNVVQTAAARIAASAGRIADRVKAFTSSLTEADFAPFLAKAQGIVSGLKPIFDAVLSNAALLAPAIGGALQQLGPVLGSALQTLAPALAQLIPQLAIAASQILPSVVQLLQALMPLLPPISQAVVLLAPLLAGFVSNVVVPLVSNTVGLIGFWSALANGASIGGTAMSAMAGKFGGAVQVISTAAAVIGIALGLIVGRIIFNLRRIVIGAIAVGGGIASFVGGAIGSFQRFSAGVNLNVGRAVQFVAGLPGRAAAALGGIGSRLFSSGAALINGFVEGIRSRIAAIQSAVGDAMAAAKRFFPNSPAKEGPFSGRGWTRFSGQATAEDWAGGITDRTSLVRKATSVLMTSAKFGANLPGTSSGGSAAVAGAGTDVVVLQSKTNVRLEDLIDVRIESATSAGARARKRGKQQVVFG